VTKEELIQFFCIHTPKEGKKGAQITHGKKKTNVFAKKKKKLG
jgi:hypothetical protein